MASQWMYTLDVDAMESHFGAMAKENLRAMDDDDAEAVLEFIRGRLDDERYPPRLKIWAIAKRCEQIDVDTQ